MRALTRLAGLTLVVAAGLAGCTAGVGAGTGGGHVPVRPVAVRPVAGHVLSWAAQDASQQHLVEYASTYALGTGGRPTGLYQVTWTYGIEGSADPGRARTVVFYDGKPQAEYAMTWGRSEITVTAVNYLARTWDRRSGPSQAVVVSAVPRNCSSDFDSANFPEFLHWGLHCSGQLKMVGAAKVDGLPVIEVVSVYRRPSGTTQEFWVSPQTYLPVRRLFETKPMPGFFGAATHEQTDYQWLAATAANLAELSVQIPAGFRSDQSQDMPYACSFVWGYVPCN